MSWDKLFALFNKDLTEEQYTPPQRSVQDVQPTEAPANRMIMPDGPSTNIGFNYLKGLDDESEDSSKHMRRFINLNKLLRGSYDGKIAQTDAKSESNIRGEDSE